MDRIAKARDALADAERAVDEAAIEADRATSEQDKAEKAEALKAKRETVEVLTGFVTRAERAMAERKSKPVYLLRVPTPRTRAAMAEEAMRLPVAPSDRAMFAAIKAAGTEAGLIPTDDPDLAAVEKALRESGGGVPDNLLGLFEGLHDRVSDHPKVREVHVARMRAQNALSLLTVRFYLKGIEGLPGAETFEIKHGLATEESLDILPPDEMAAIEQKIAELGTLRGREGNFSGSLSPSQSSRTPSPTE
ncbi:hypothetical protein [Azospirillum canadense]|uniref:hypothetical protein n=1 Tax=Azospirillum canadense TaxID=403962 RepID=UPI0022274055|nr:hypothetical protein [Azospirillum canadense]MCW2242262.1 hypothetical protein [Azospirillum canadense]